MCLNYVSETQDSMQLPSTSSSNTNPMTRLCEYCLEEVALHQWLGHIRSMKHKRKSTEPYSEGLKVSLFFHILN